MAKAKSKTTKKVSKVSNKKGAFNKGEHSLFIYTIALSVLVIAVILALMQQNM